MLTIVRDMRTCTKCKKEHTSSLKLCEECREKVRQYREKMKANGQYGAYLEKQRELMRRKRENPEYRARELEYQMRYCDERGKTLHGLWQEIRGMHEARSGNSAPAPVLLP